MRSPKADMLSELIQSLSASEKRYFRLSTAATGSNKDYQKIFDAVDIEKVPGKSLKKWQSENAVNASYEKSYLQKMLFRALRNFHEDQSIDTSLYQTLIDVEVLTNKKHHDFALSLIKKAIAIAEENENFIILQELIKWHIRIMNRTNAKNKMYKEFNALMELASECMRKTENAYIYADLSEQAWSLAQRKGYMAGAKELEENNKILSHPYFQDESMALTYNNKIFFFNVQAICYTNISRHEKAYEMISRSVAHIESRPGKIREDPKNYIMALNNMAAIARNAGMIDEAMKTLDKMERLPGMKGINMSKSSRDHIMGTVIESKMAIYTFDMRDYKKGIEWYDKSKAEIDANGIELHSAAMLWRHYELAVCFFYTQQYEWALDELRVFLHDHDDQRSDYLLCVHLLHIMVQFELGNHSLLPHLIRSVRRFADSRGFKEKSIVLILQMFNKLAKKNSKRDVREIAKSFIPKFKALNEVSKESAIQKSTNLEQWLESKL